MNDSIFATSHWQTKRNDSCINNNIKDGQSFPKLSNPNIYNKGILELMRKFNNENYMSYTFELFFPGYAIKSNSDNSNILLLNFYELWNIFSCNFKFQFHKHIFTIYLRETKYCKTNRNMHFNIHIIISSNYIPFHANYDIKNTLCNFHILYFETQVIYCNSNSSFPKLNIKQNNIMYHLEFKCNHAALIKVIVNLFQDNKFRRHIISIIFHKNIMCIFTKGLYKIPSNKNNELYKVCYYKCNTLYIYMQPIQWKYKYDSPKTILY